MSMHLKLEDRTFEDIDDEAKCMVGYNQRYQQLSRGSFQGHYKAAHLGTQMILYFEQNNQVLDQSGVTPADRYTIIFLLNEGVPTRMNGQDFTQDDLFICGPQSTFDTIGLPLNDDLGANGLGPHFVAISIDQNYFEAAVLGSERDGEACSVIRKHGVRETRRQNVLSIRYNIAQFMSEFYRSGHGAVSAALAARASISEMLFSHISRIMQGPLQPQEILSPPRAYRVTRQAREYLDAHHDADVSISRLCRELDVSRRSLEYYFQDQVSLSPTAYLRTLRLNEVRRAMLAFENVDRSIGDLAAEAGFWHPSRFASHYRLQFGELPSQTRERERIHVQ